MNYHNITKDDMLNGDGLRVVLWVSGCSHYCPQCQNSETWDCDSGILFDDDARQEIFDYLEKDYVNGITFSGGDPLHENNVDTCYKLAEEIREKYPEKTIWLYSGYTLQQLKDDDREIGRKRLDFVRFIDVFVDGPFIMEIEDMKYKWAGSRNQIVWKKEEIKKEIG